MASGNASDLDSALKTWFGHGAFRSGQREIVEAAVCGVDLLAILPTGGGKSVCYQLPAVLGQGITLVISPLIALMKDQVDGLPCGLRRRATWLSSTLSAAEREERHREIASGHIKLLYAAPERLRSKEFTELLRRAGLERVVVDEAHCISEWGHDFRPDYRAIGELVAEIRPRHVMALTATAPPRVRDDIQARLGRRLKRFVRAAFRPNLHLSVCRLRSEEDKLAWFDNVTQKGCGQGLVYASSRRKCEQLARRLIERGIQAGYYHAGLTPSDRAAVQDRFMAGGYPVLIATVAFGMGIDKPDIRYLVHYQPSRSLENYTQESGRAGRDGQSSWCALLAAPADLRILTRDGAGSTPNMDSVRATYDLLRSRAHRRLAWIPTTGGADKEEEWGASIAAVMPILEDSGLVRRRLPGIWERGMAIASGSDNPADVGSTEPPNGLGRGWHPSGPVDLWEILSPPDRARERVEALLRARRATEQARVKALREYIRRDSCRHKRIARYFGDRWAAGKCGICDCCHPDGGPPIRRGRTRDLFPLPVPAKSAKFADSEQDQLAESLRHWRTQEARARGVPTFVVMPNSTLEAIISRPPRDMSSLASIPGLGKLRLERYGASLLRMVESNT